MSADARTGPTTTKPSTTPTAQDIARAAERLLEARESRVPCAPVRDLIGSDDVEAAYAVQELLTAARNRSGARVVGRKIGLTSEVVQRQLGVHQPDFGVLFDDMQVLDGGQVPEGWLLQPKVEAEVAFVLGRDLGTDPGDDLELDTVRAAVDHAVAAIEIVDSRVAGWDISFADTVADNASSGLFVLGRRQVPLSELAPADVGMTLRLDGEVVSTGTGRACLGDPLVALAWLARTARDLGRPLLAGQVVLSGALGPMVPVIPGSEVVVDIDVLGPVAARFERSRP